MRNPGIHKSELQRVLKLGWGTIAYHVHALKTRQRITAVQQGHVVRLFPVGVSPQQMAWFSAVRNAMHASLLEKIARHPGARAAELGAATGLSTGVVRRHLATMAAHGLVTTQGLYGRRYFISEQKFSAIGLFLAHGLPAGPAAPAQPALDELPAIGQSRRYDGEGSRERILSAVQASPGIHTGELTRVTGVSWGNLAHHLRILEAEGILERSMHGHRTCYFPPEVPLSERAQMVARRRLLPSRILDTLARQPGLMVHELAREVGARPGAVGRNLRSLVDEGLVRASDPEGTRFEVFRASRGLAEFPREAEGRGTPVGLADLPPLPA